MSEVESKFKFAASISDRVIVLNSLANTARCSTCGSGPVDTTEAQKLLNYGRVWDWFQLDDLSALSPGDISSILKEDKSTVDVTFTAGALRFLIENLLARSYIFQTFPGIAELLSRLLEIANRTNTKLPNSDSDGIRKPETFTFSFQEITAITTVLFSFKPCHGKLQLNDGSQIDHGIATDYPKSVKEFITYTRLVDQLKLGKLLLGKDSLNKYDGVEGYELDSETASYLSSLIVNRSSNITFPQNKLASIISKLGVK